MAPVDVGLLSLPGYDLGADFRRCYVCIVYSIEIPIPMRVNFSMNKDSLNICLHRCPLFLHTR